MEKERKLWTVDTKRPVTELLDKAIIENQEVKERVSLYASDVFQCPRKIVFDFKNESNGKDKFDANTLRIFDNGNSVHERLLKYFKQAGIFVDSEVDIPRDELDIHGRLDCLYRYGSELRVAEFKSINLPFVGKPKEEHEAQLMIYLHYLKLNNGIIIYESKPNNRIYGFDVSYDPEKVLEILDWFKMVKEHVRTNTIPPVKYNKSSYPCSTQSFKCCYWSKCHDLVPSPKMEELINEQGEQASSDKRELIESNTEQSPP